MDKNNIGSTNKNENKGNNKNEMENKNGNKNENENIEKFIEILQKNPSPEALAAALTAVRRRMNEKGEFVIAVKNPGPVSEKNQTLQLEAIEDDGEKWLVAFTSFEEELQGSSPVMSAFKADINAVLDMALNEPDAAGVILNPWRRTLKLNKHLIRIIKGS